MDKSMTAARNRAVHFFRIQNTPFHKWLKWDMGAGLEARSRGGQLSVQVATKYAVVRSIPESLGCFPISSRNVSFWAPA